jgi:hypothetical protein
MSSSYAVLALLSLAGFGAQHPTCAEAFSVGAPQSICKSPTECRRYSARTLVLPLLDNRHTQSALSILSAKSQQLVDERWYPQSVRDDDRPDDDNDENDRIAQLEADSVELAATLIRNRLEGQTHDRNLASKTVQSAVRGRFIDLACSLQGEQALENLFGNPTVNDFDLDVVRGTVMTLQSLIIMATQTGVKGDPMQLQRMVSHLDARADPTILERDLYTWDRDSVRRLKYRLNRIPAVQLLAALQWKRSNQGAFDLLVQLGAWDFHEDLALIRSGFPLRFHEAEMEAAARAAEVQRDPDSLLGIRRDLRDLKVYTIDGESTTEIDDGLSIEIVRQPDGTERQAIWIHIADADRWAPRNSTLFHAARTRYTSLYLPRGSCPMFPPQVSDNVMSLVAGQDACALSLRVMLNEDGSIDASTLIVTPSLIHVDYRLTYNDVDEMLAEGIGYREEWELGALLGIANARRDCRIRNGSSEGWIPNPIPYATISTKNDVGATDGVAIELEIQVSHNAGKNYSAEDALDESKSPINVLPVSAAYLMVTEAMILAGESLGRWQSRLEEEEKSINGSHGAFQNYLRLPFRTQPKPDWASRAREKKITMDLLEYNIGNGLCHAWYARRFLQSVRVTETRLPHFGLGLDSYIQWTSPIRRFSDLQAHSAVKRFLRRKRVHQLLHQGSPIPEGIQSSDLGWPGDALEDKENLINLSRDDVDQDINFLESVGLMGAAKVVQRQSQQFWLFEHIRRLHEVDPDIKFNAVVLGCIDPEKRQFAIYVHELGLEHRYTAPGQGRLNQGTEMILKVDSVSPRYGLLSFVWQV